MHACMVEMGKRGLNNATLEIKKQAQYNTDEQLLKDDDMMTTTHTVYFKYE